jgi:hypothetical protein
MIFPRHAAFVPSLALCECRPGERLQVEHTTDSSNLYKEIEWRCSACHFTTRDGDRGEIAVVRWSSRGVRTQKYDQAFLCSQATLKAEASNVA